MEKMIYRPLTATPFNYHSGYQEVEPCRMLQPYVRCFWGGVYDCPDGEGSASFDIVIPDTCVDIIYQIDDAGNIINSDFVGVSDRSFWMQNSKKPGHKIFTFAIRFYAWSAYLFSEDSFAGTINGRCDVRERFSWLDWELRGRLSETGKMMDLIQLTESLLLKKLDNARCKKPVDEVIQNILQFQGALEISELSKLNFISNRQMERLFQEYIGITPKKLSNLIRYQFLWRDIVSRKHFDIANAVFEYGYTDAPHLMREFKRYHSMNIREAKELALRNPFNKGNGV